MSLFRRREPPKAAVCCASPAMTRRAADWLRALGGCKPIAILSDDCEDVVWPVSYTHLRYTVSPPVPF